MRPGAHVKSIEALEGFRAALYLFGNDVGQALDSIQSEIQDFVEWLEVEQIKVWRAEIRSRENKVAEAKADLHRCLSATIDPHRTPTCYQEKKILDAAKKRLNEAEDKLATVRRWIPIVRQAVIEYRMKVEPLRSAVSSDVPVAAASLASAVNRLHEYLSIAPPSGDISETPPELSRPAESVSLLAAASVTLPHEEPAAQNDEAAPGEESRHEAGPEEAAGRDVAPHEGTP